MLFLGDDEVKDDTTLVFELKVKCIKNKNAPKDATDPDELYLNSKGLTLFTLCLPCKKKSQVLNLVQGGDHHCMIFIKNITSLLIYYSHNSTFEMDSNTSASKNGNYLVVCSFIYPFVCFLFIHFFLQLVSQSLCESIEGPK